jgi:DNA excision repair protein ERCC-2
MKKFSASVGELVSFLYRSGDLSSETFQNVSALEGIKAHQYIQSLYQSTDQYELPIQGLYVDQDYEILLSGRIDGLLTIDQELVIEEIKSSRKNIFDDDFVYNNEHLAQLKMYAYMYMVNHHLTDIKARIKYVMISDYKIRNFDFVFDIDILKEFFIDSIILYIDWLDRIYNHQVLKKESISTLIFPFENYRRGQREMMSAVYQTMIEDDLLYVIAPTGIGKTMASLFSTIKSLNDDKQKIFYLTAKTQGKKIALDSMDILHEANLETKTLEITSKDAICFLDKRECDPEKCPYAKGFFDRLTDATKDIFDSEKLMDRATVERYAKKHMVCPFEFSLYISYFVDVIICDYNYVFDPTTHLIRYFDDDTYKPLLLIDEAHNMIKRSNDMYSKSLFRSDFIKLRRDASKMKPSIRNIIKQILDYFDSYIEALKLNPFITSSFLDDQFLELIYKLMKKIENALKDNPKYHKKFDVLETYFELLKFIRINEYYNDSYLTNIELIDEDIKITLNCLDAGNFVLDTIKNKTYGTVFFSATLYPLDYYKELLSRNLGETLKIRSPFDSNRLKLIVMDNISTRYQDRQSSISYVIEAIETVILAKKGNYIVFFPSYQYLYQVLNELPDHLDANIIIQEKDMEQAFRNQIIEQFKNHSNQSNLALFVMGGMFSEGIDYVGDMLNGVIIVGVGLPMLNDQNNQLKDYYQQKFNKGFDYAYTYPGMNKVIQAVGRVIRRDLDYGIALLIDDRFNTSKYKKLFPIEWKHYEIIKDNDHLKKSLSSFWLKFK